MPNSVPPWAAGPGELLGHGIALLREDSDASRRIAMILIDNSVELTIRTFLGLPKRATGIAISRKELDRLSTSFPDLLDALEQHAASKVAGINLAEIEWFHRLRNQLYHQGNGLTIERAKVDVYAQLANALFKNLFGEELVHSSSGRERLLGEFLTAWIELQRTLEFIGMAYSSGDDLSYIDVARFLSTTDMVNRSDIDEFDRLRKLRNDLVHGMVNPQTLTEADVKSVRTLRQRLQDTG